MESKTSSPGKITTELMQQILREGEKDDTIEVLPRLEVDELTEDFHVGSCLSRVRVEYTRSGDTSQHTLSVLVKVVLEKNIVAGADQHSTSFPREIQMYNEILPRMSALLSRALGDRHTEFFARMYYTQETPTYLIAVEDLAPKGFKTLKPRDGLDLKHCLLTLRTLARFHAASAMLKRQDGSLFSVFDEHSFREEGTAAALKDFSRKAIPLITRATENWPEFGPSWANRLRRRYETLFDDLDLLLERDDSGFNVLTHGDFGIHNVMYRHSESTGELEAIMLVDFQCCSYNSPALDLHQFISISASEDVRNNHTETLLKEYHTELTTTLEALRAPKELIITQKQLLSEFENKTFFSFLYATCFLPASIVFSDTSTGLKFEDLFAPNGGGFDQLQVLPDSFFNSLRKYLTNFSQKKLI